MKNYIKWKTLLTSKKLIVAALFNNIINNIHLYTVIYLYNMFFMGAFNYRLRGLAEMDA